MAEMKYSLLAVSHINDKILKVELNRPELHNAFNDELIKELISFAENIKNDPNIRIIILSGKGKSFCAGADLNWMKKTKTYSYEENKNDALKLGKLFHLWNDLPFAVIGRINGAAIGGGTGLVSICDLTFGLKNSKFGFSEVNLGIVPAVISPFVIAKIGEKNARELFVTGEIFNGDKAVEVGLLNYALENHEQMDEEINKKINFILASGPNAVSESKNLLSYLQNVDLNLVLEHTAKKIAHLRTSEEGQEGISAFLEKRNPKWYSKKED